MSRKIRWHKNGRRVSEASLKKAQAAYVKAYQTGRLGTRRVKIDEQLAELIECMETKAFAAWTGVYTWQEQSTGQEEKGGD